MRLIDDALPVGVDLIRRQRRAPAPSSRRHTKKAAIATARLSERLGMYAPPSLPRRVVQSGRARTAAAYPMRRARRKPQTCASGPALLPMRYPAPASRGVPVRTDRPGPGAPATANPQAQRMRLAPGRKPGIGSPPDQQADRATPPRLGTGRYSARRRALTSGRPIPHPPTQRPLSGAQMRPDLHVCAVVLVRGGARSQHRAASVKVQNCAPTGWTSFLARPRLLLLGRALQPRHRACRRLAPS